jgi:hypothetical protein
MMHVSVMIAMLAVAGILGFCGWIFLFRTGHVVHLARHTHRVSPRWVQNWPFHGHVHRDWYPGYLRVGGIVSWLLALCLVLKVVLALLH